MSSNFIINMTEGNGITNVKLTGRLDTNAAIDVELSFHSLSDSTKKVIFDCKNLDYISSSGLRLLMQSRKKYGDNAVKLINVNSSVMEIMEVTGFDKMLSIKTTNVNKN